MVIDDFHLFGIGPVSSMEREGAGVFFRVIALPDTGDHPVDDFVLKDQFFGGVALGGRFSQTVDPV